MAMTAIKAGACARKLWDKACEHDKIVPTERFVVFSDDNPHVSAYNRAIGRYLKLIRKVGHHG